MTESIKRHCATVIKSLEMEIAFAESEIKRFKQFIDYIDRKSDLVLRNTVENVPVDLFARFESDRVRVPITNEEKMECLSNPIETARIRSLWNQWRKESQVSGLTSDQVITRLIAKYGEPEKSKLWSQIKVFASDEDAKEWDDAHEVKLNKH